MAKYPTLDDFLDGKIQEAAAGLKQDGPPPHPVYWITEHFIDPITDKLMELVPYQRRILRRALEIDDQGRSRYDLVIWSQPKKSGKTTLAAAVGAYVACNIEAPNEVSCVANDQEQSAGRIFANMMPTLRALGWRVPSVLTGEPIAYGPNGTFVKAITTRYEKEAGANQGLSLWSELWGYKGERLTRLWEEMTPPPTRKFRMRWVETYAGFIGQNLLLQSLYLRVFKDFEKPGQAIDSDDLREGVVKLWKDLPVYEVDDRILVFWDHDHRMPWQDKPYYDSQLSSGMRLNSFLRLHGNYWVSGDDNFITEEMWRDSVRSEYNPVRATYALDSSVNSDTTALKGVIV